MSPCSNRVAMSVVSLSLWSVNDKVPLSASVLSYPSITDLYVQEVLSRYSIGGLCICPLPQQQCTDPADVYLVGVQRSKLRTLRLSLISLCCRRSCRGLRVLVELLDEDYGLNKELVLSALEGIGSVFQ